MLLASLEAFLCQLAVDKKRALLIVDEAQNLTPRAVEELRMLSNFQLGDQALLQSFLVGQPELRAMMQSPQMQQLRQRVIASYHLGPLDKAETQAYIEHRLKHVGWKDDPQFDPACFDLIHTLTGGIPRRINTLCNRLLLAAFLAEQHVLETADVQAIAHEIRDELGPDAAARVRCDAASSTATTLVPSSPLMARLEAGGCTRTSTTSRSASTAWRKPSPPPSTCCTGCCIPKKRPSPARPRSADERRNRDRWARSPASSARGRTT